MKTLEDVLRAVDYMLQENEKRINNQNFGDTKDFCKGYEQALKNLKFIITTSIRDYTK